MNRHTLTTTAVVIAALAALATTMSRGAWLGGFAALALFGGIGLWKSGRRAWVRGGAAAAIALLAGVAALNLVPSLTNGVSNPWVRRVASLVETDPASSGGSRLRGSGGLCAGALMRPPGR